MLSRLVNPGLQAHVVFRNHRKSGNLTGRFNSSSANCVTFFGHYRYMRTVLIGAIRLIRLGNYLLKNEDPTVYGLQLFAIGPAAA